MRAVSLAQGILPRYQTKNSKFVIPAFSIALIELKSIRENGVRSVHNVRKHFSMTLPWRLTMETRTAPVVWGWVSVHCKPVSDSHLDIADASDDRFIDTKYYERA